LGHKRQRGIGERAGASGIIFGIVAIVLVMIAIAVMFYSSSGSFLAAQSDESPNLKTGTSP